MDYQLRVYFDQQVDYVLERLPEEIHRILEEIPLYVEDRPDRQLMEEMNLKHPLAIYGCFRGHTQSQRKGPFPISHPSVIQIFREAILNSSLDDEDYIVDETLRNQIRVTILHEIAHYLGMSEEELSALGYG